MSFTSLQSSHGSGSGGVRYLLRELERDAIGREVQRALDSLLGRDGARPELAEADRADEFIEWLGSDDSPLLLENVSQFVLDPEEHLRSLAERVEGTSRAAERVGAELTGAARPSSDVARRARELGLRVLTFAELDAERVRGAPRRRGTPRGETRFSYLGLFSPPRDLSNREIKRIVSGVIGPRWPGAVAIGYVHRDTDNVHLHLWLSAETTSGRKIDVRRLTPSGDPVLDKYPDLDEQVALALSRHFGDPSIVETHLAKKLEWVYWREQFDAAIARGERPPVMPYRARHDFDLIGEAKALAGRERGDGRRREAGAGKAAPVPRANSLAGALELWGKVVHLEARVGYRRELLATLDAWRGECGEPADDVRRYFERRLEEAERDCARHKDAFEKTLANRAREGYPELRHPLHNGKQIAEMEQIARLTRDPELLRHVRAYTTPGRPDDAEGRAREIATLWRDHVEARLEARERAETLARAAGLSGGANERGLTGVAPGGRGERLDHDRVTVGGWLGGGWTPGQMRSSLSCLESEGVRAHGRRYVHALEYLAATGEALAECRAVGPPRTVRPLLDESDLARIDRLVLEESARVGAGERAMLADLASVAWATEADPGEARRLFEATLEADRFRHGGINRARPSLGGQVEFRPHDDQWVGRLAADLTLKEAEALALAAGGAARSRFDAAREEAGVLRQLLELSREVRAAAGVTPDAPAAVFDAVQERALDSHRHDIGEALGSRGAGWAEWQAEGVGEFRHVLPERERERAGRFVEEAKARIENEWRAAALRRVEPQFAAAAERYLLVVYDEEGLEGMRLPLRQREHVAALAEQLSCLARDSEVDPERLGAEALRARAERAFSEAVGHLAREEREAAELGRLEAKMILACAERDAAAAELQRFCDHSHFLRWNYETGDGKQSWSLCEVRLALHEKKDPVSLLVAQDAEQHIMRSVDEARAESAARIVARAVEAQDATAAYEARAQELTHLRLATPVPVFEPGELGRLEEAAFAARNPHQIAIVARSEGERYGAVYAAARAKGRVLRAAAEQGKEHGAPEWFERPAAAARLDRLPGPARTLLSEALGRHLDAREVERDVAATFRRGLQAQADARAAHAPRTPEGHVKPLITESEARQICERWASSKAPARRSWEEMTRNAEVAVETEGPHRGGVITYQEWWSQNSFRVTPARHFEKRIEDATVMSRAGAKEKLRQQAKERGDEYRAPRR